LIQDILELVNLTEKADTLIAGLSRGMQQKLSLGRCLIHSPELLLLDEPASGLDPRARIELLALLRELKAMGKTIFISSHILSELHNLCDTVVIINGGRQVYAGDVEEASRGVLQGRKVLELAVEGDADRASAFLKEQPGVLGVRHEGRQIVLDITEEQSTADLIEACVKAGIRIEAALPAAANLEQIFMHLTAGSG
jgi:ABC-2 type transport system ATP-binding protein